MASIKRSGFSTNQNQLSIIFKALGHPARIAIIEALIENDRIPCKSLLADIPISNPTLSNHLQVLFQCGLIGYEKVGNNTYYVLNPIALETAKIYLKNNLNKSVMMDTNYRNVHFNVQPQF